MEPSIVIALITSISGLILGAFTFWSQLRKDKRTAVIDAKRAVTEELQAAVEVEQLKADLEVKLWERLKQELDVEVQKRQEFEMELNQLRVELQAERNKRQELEQRLAIEVTKVKRLEKRVTTLEDEKRELASRNEQLQRENALLQEQLAGVDANESAPDN